MAGDADLRRLLHELRSVLPTNGLLGQDMQSMFSQCGYLGAGARNQRIVYKDADVARTVKRILQHETFLAGRTHVSAREIQAQIDRRVPFYKQHLQEFAKLKERKKQLNPFSESTKKQLKEETQFRLNQLLRMKRTLNIEQSKLQFADEQGVISDEARAKFDRAIEEQRTYFFLGQLELKIAQSTFVKFQTYENRFEDAEEVNVARAAKNRAMAEFKRLRKRLSPLVNRQKRDPQGLSYYETDDIFRLTPLYCRAYAAKCYYINQFESVQVRYVGKLLAAMQTNGLNTEDAMKREVDRMKQEARDFETPLHAAEQTLRSLKRMQLKEINTPADAVDSTPENWDDEAIEDAVNAAQEADAQMADDDENNETENNDSADDQTAGAAGN